MNPLFDVHLTPETQAQTSSEDISLLVRIINLIVMIFPPAGLIVGIVLLWGPHFSWTHLCMFVGMYLITGFGITVGYHRLFTHKSFETSRWMKLMLAICGSMAVQGPLLKWSPQVHRRHHQHSDTHDDPHSPHQHGHDFRDAHRSVARARRMDFHRADRSWQLRRRPAADRARAWSARCSSLWVALGLLIPTLLADCSR